MWGDGDRFGCWNLVDDAATRRALSLAINRQALVDATPAAATDEAIAKVGGVDHVIVVRRTGEVILDIQNISLHPERSFSGSRIACAHC